jgi:hypothetical protein
MSYETCGKQVSDDDRYCGLEKGHRGSCGGNRIVVIDYTSWRGVRSHRKIQPLSIYRGSNVWHKKEQWLLDAVDLEDPMAKVKSFAMSNIHAWTEVEVI